MKLAAVFWAFMLLAEALFTPGGFRGTALAELAESSPVGIWALGGHGVGVTGGYGDAFVLILGADGKAVKTNVEGCMIISEPATWETKGNVLRLTPSAMDELSMEGGRYVYRVDGVKRYVNDLGDPDEYQEYLYSIEGNRLVLKPAAGGKEMRLAKREKTWY